MPFYLWSKIFGNNGSIDPSVNMAEGMSPSAVNDSCRAIMGILAMYRDDITGSIVTSGTSTAYVVASNSGFDTLAHMNGQIIAFSPHIINGAGSPSVTLNVDGLGAFPIRSAPSVEIASGTLSQGTPYLVIFNNTDGAFYLHGFFGNPYSIPLGASMDFWGTTAPNSSFVFPYGQAISRATYAPLFTMFGTTYGAGDGTTTFNIPDLRGRIVGCVDNMGGTDAARLNGSAVTSVRTTLGGGGGEAVHTLITPEIPTHNHGISDPGHTHIQQTQTVYQTSGSIVSGGTGTGLNPVPGTTTQSSTTGISTTNTGSGSSHNNVQPILLGNRILRVA